MPLLQAFDPLGLNFPCRCECVQNKNLCVCVHTRAHVDEGVIDEHEFVEVELVGEPLPFGLVENPLVVVVSAEIHRIM